MLDDEQKVQTGSSPNTNWNAQDQALGKLEIGFTMMAWLLLRTRTSALAPILFQRMVGSSLMQCCLMAYASQQFCIAN